MPAVKFILLFTLFVYLHLKGNKSVYYYWAYGLTVKSEIAFPELFPIVTSHDVDIEIKLGRMPDSLMSLISIGKTSSVITHTEYLLAVTEVASYYAGFGNMILIQIEPNADWNSIRLFCLSNAFAAILYQRKSIPIHCSAFLHHDQLILIFGDSGVGKSTTLGAMIKRGYKVFSDDVCVPVIKASGTVCLYSSYPMQKYWKDTTNLLEIDKKQLSRQIRPDIEKYALYFHDQFITESVKPVLIFVLNVSNDADFVSVRPIAGIELFKQLEHNAYRGEQLGYTHLKKEHFTLFTNLANQCFSFYIQRPREIGSLDQIVSIIEQKISTILDNNV